MHSLHIQAHLPPDDALYRIRDVASAGAAARLPRGTVVILAVPGMDPGTAAHFESNINASLGECGCRLSAVFLVIAVCAAAVIDVLQWPFIRQAPITAITSELAAAFIASGIGRIAGIAHARHTLRKTLSAISRRMTGQVAEEGSWAA